MRLYWAVATCAALAWGQPRCVVHEELRAQTQTARFALGAATATLTLPNGLFESDPPTVFVEVEGDGSSYFLASADETVSLRQGASIHLRPGPLERHRFTILAPDRAPLCTWQPRIRRAWQPARPPTRPENFHQAEAGILRRTGDPILLNAGGARNRTFQIAGEPATVLARTGFEVILRDPHPAAGVRTVESNGFTVNLRFFDADLRMALKSFTIRAPDLPLGTTDRLWPRERPWRTGLYGAPILSVFNFDPRNRLLCGDSRHEANESFEHASVRITHNMLRGRSFEFTCRIQVSNVPAEIDFLIFDQPFLSSGTPLSVIPHIPR